MRLNKLKARVTPQRPLPSQAVFGIWPAAFLSVISLHPHSPTPPFLRNQHPRTPQVVPLTMEIATRRQNCAVACDNLGSWSRCRNGRGVASRMLWVPTLGVWQVGLRQEAPGPLSKHHTAGAFTQFLCSRAWGGSGCCRPQSFFRRLYISLLLFSPAQVRLLVRNFFRSSLKSS